MVWPPTPPGPSNISSACQLYDLGFDHYNSQVNRQVFSGLPDAKSTAFLQMLASQVQIPAALQPKWIKALNGIVKANEAPAIFTSLACAWDKQKTEDACKFVVMMGKHNPSTLKSDIVLVQVAAAFGINVTDATQPVLEVTEVRCEMLSVVLLDKARAALGRWGCRLGAWGSRLGA